MSGKRKKNVFHVEIKYESPIRHDVPFLSFPFIRPHPLLFKIAGQLSVLEYRILLDIQPFKPSRFILDNRSQPVFTLSNAMIAFNPGFRAFILFTK